MTYGLTDSGFNLKNLAAIKEEIEQDLRDGISSDLELTSDTPEGQLVGVFSKQLSDAWQALEAVYYSRFRHTATGNSLDYANTMIAVTRKGATSSKATLRVYGDLGVVIPSGSIVSRLNYESVKFATSGDATIDKQLRESFTIEIPSDAVSGTYKVIYNGDESEALEFDHDEQALVDALKTIPDLAGLTITVSLAAQVFTVEIDEAQAFTDFAIENIDMLNESAESVSPTLASVVKGDADHAEVEVVCTETGAIVAPANSLTVIEFDVDGVESVSNPEAAEVGDVRESDADYTRRADESLSTAGSATLEAIKAAVTAVDDVNTVLAYENDRTVTDEQGIPPGQVLVVVDGGDDDEIGAALWESKGGGTGYYGDVEVTVQDDDGNNQLVYFSRPTSTTLYIIVDITKGDDYPADGDDQVKAALVAYGATLAIGDSLNVNPKLASSLADIDGIDNLELYVGTAAEPVNQGTLSPAATEVFSISADNIEVNDV